VIVVERLATAADLDGVLEVEEASFNNPTTREWYEAELKRPEVCFIYVLRTPRAPVEGFCAFWLVGDQAHINQLAIHPDRRRQGLGRHLIDAIAREAARLGGSQTRQHSHCMRPAALRAKRCGKITIRTRLSTH
jgi:ribosomal-protein-alanine N-acetyltransferase